MGNHIWRPEPDYAHTHCIRCIRCPAAVWLDPEAWERVCEAQSFEGIEHIGKAIYLKIDNDKPCTQEKTINAKPLLLHKP
jgi:hypothetical protein